MALIEVADFPAVRAALDTTLTADELPDSTINLPLYAGEADLTVRTLVPTWEDMVSVDQLARLKSAAIYFCAALLAPAVPRFNKESVGGGDHSYSTDNPSAQEMATLLRARAMGQLTALTPTENTPRVPVLFTVAPGGRAQRRRAY
jgi:hypothetical protein